MKRQYDDYTEEQEGKSQRGCVRDGGSGSWYYKDLKKLALSRTPNKSSTNLLRTEDQTTPCTSGHTQDFILGTGYRIQNLVKIANFNLRIKI